MDSQEAGRGSPPPDDAYRGLRDGLLHLVPGDVGITPTQDAPRAWGVLLEMGRPGGTATVVALADGTASLYTSTGGGIVGGGFHERVAAAARRCVHQADRALEAFPPVETVPLPAAGRSSLVVLAYDGPRRIEFDEGAASELPGPIPTVYLAVHGVITELRQLRPPVPPPSPAGQ